jgi:hypothetical protein
MLEGMTKIGIQLDESVNISNLELLTHWLYCFKNRVREDALFRQPLEGSSANYANSSHQRTVVE